ncbi:MAG: hypothetical protein F4X65_00265 [Chloroflexi bacterium]|nr:hypothetical protein [Chloroflexota bacterium]
MEIRGTAEMDFGVLGVTQDPETGRRRPMWALLVRTGNRAKCCLLLPTRTQKLDEVVARTNSRGTSLTPGFLKYSHCRGFTAHLTGADTGEFG